jgi:hypothetical protein
MSAANPAGSRGAQAREAVAPKEGAQRSSPRAKMTEQEFETVWP